MIGRGIKWMLLLTGTMIGAGYASGREIWQFFGADSVVAILLFSGLFMICSYVILKLSISLKAENYVIVLEALLGKRLAKAYDKLIILYLFLTTGIMISGGGATLQTFELPYWFGIGLMCILLVVLFIWDLDGLTSVNNFLTPMLIICLVVILIFFQWTSEGGFSLEWGAQSNWPSALTFTALNLLPVVAVLSAIGTKIEHKGEVWIATIGSGLILGGVSLIYNQSLLRVADDLLLYEIPLFSILSSYPSILIFAMTILLWTAIFTTAAANILGLLSRFKNLFTAPGWLLTFVIVIALIPMTTFGFSTLVGFLYPLYGMLNLYLLGSVLLFPFLQEDQPKLR
ncbi:membrane protein [Bacillaceae bacterium JMAK1]|nr:membrane protein [Bacillaceae bacterium JMAK1]